METTTSGRIDSAEYRAAYRKGWQFSRRGSSLDAADAKGYTRSAAWNDGYSDFAAGREMWHYLTCAGDCGEH